MFLDVGVGERRLEENVVVLEIGVDDTALVHVCKSAQEMAGDALRKREREGCAAADLQASSRGISANRPRPSTDGDDHPALHAFQNRRL